MKLLDEGLLRKGICTAAGCLLAATTVWATELNGFVREKGKGDVALSWTSQSYDEFWLGETKMSTPTGGDLDTDTLALWADYGVTDSLTLVANLPYVKADGSESFPSGLTGTEDEVEGMQDLSLLGKYRFAALTSGSVRHDFVGAFGIRTIASNYDVPGPVDIGDGTADWLFRFVYQLNVGAFYISQQVGYDLRSGDAPNQWPLYTEAGYTTGPVTWSLMYTNVSARGGTDIAGPGFISFSGNKEEYERLGAKAYGRLNDNFGLSGMYFTTLDGRNTGDASGFSVGVVFSY